MAVKFPTKAGELKGNSQQNPIAWLQVKVEEGDLMFKGWLAQQSLPVEAAVVTATSVIPGALIGCFLGALNCGNASSLIMPPPNAAGFMASLKQAQAKEKESSEGHGRSQATTR